MSAPQESWKDVASKVESLGLKLKMHLEQEQDDTAAEPQPGDTKAAFEDLGKQLQDAFDSFGNVAKDPAIHSDVKDIGNLLKDALVETFNAVGAEVENAMRKAESASESAAVKVADALGATPADKSVVDATSSDSDSVQDTIEEADEEE